MIAAGAGLVENFKPVLLAFAGVLVYSAYGLLTKDEEEEGEKDLSDDPIVQFVRRFLTVSDGYDGDNFFTSVATRDERTGIETVARVATPLLLVLAVIELTDVVFAVDSIPAVFGVTLDPFIVWTSNMFAILSLR